MDVTQVVASLVPDLVATRRDLHTYAESGWTEFRTASIVIQRLQAMGYEVAYGKELFHPDFMAGVPAKAELEKHMQRAIAQGADPKLVEAMAGGCTGVVATLRCGEGPTIGLRFDIDALDITESTDADHAPAAQGFGSKNPGAMHACGHDGHTAIGLGVAQALMQLKDKLQGTVKIIFQPAEEGVRGARAMVEAGIVDDVNYLIGAHLGFAAKETGLVVCGTTGFLATSKLDAIFTGVPAHAGAAPQEGKNAMLAAATAALNLHAIARHAAGASRINVGVLQAGSGRNVVPASATLKLETRGETTVIDGFMREEAERIIKAAAAMWDVAVKLEPMGSAAGATSDEELAAVIAQVAAGVPGVTKIQEKGLLGGSEDYTWMMERVQQRGGKATYVMVGSQIAAPHHDSRFTFDETSLGVGVEVLTRAVLALASH